MDRICGKCGTLITGNGHFCPYCGAKLESTVDLRKPDMKTNAVQSPYGDSRQIDTFDPSGQNNHYSNYSPKFGTPAYSLNNNVVYAEASMTVKQWVGTILLSSYLGIISIALLFFWGFSEGAPAEKKTFARAYLIVTAILVGVVFLIAFGAGLCSG